MATQEAHGSQTATIDTEHTLDTRSADGVYQLKVDLGNLTYGDTVEIRVKDKARKADAANKEADCAIYSGPQTQPIIYSDPITSDSVSFSLKQTLGTGRVFTWSVWSF